MRLLLHHFLNVYLQLHTVGHRTTKACKRRAKR